MGACQPASACGIQSNDTEFQDEKNLVFNTKYDKILYTLKKLKRKAEKYGDVSSSKDLDWVLTAIQEKDLHEPDYNLSGGNGSTDKEKMEILANYTNMQRTIGLKNDAQKVTKKIEEKDKNKKPVRYAGFINKFKRSVSNILMNLEKKENFAMKGLTPEQVTNIATILSKIGSYEFNIFELDKYAGKNAIYFVLNQGLTRFGLMKYLKEPKFVEFSKELMEGYSREVIYHNDLHGADVCQTTIIEIEKGNLVSKLKLGDIDIIAVLTAAAAHDFKHNGFNNNFQVNRGTDMALTYNDNTVLENWHVSQTFKVLLKQGNNFIEGFSPEEYRHFRRRMIDCILCTDMARHAQLRSQTNALISQYGIKNGENIGGILVDDPAKRFDNQQNILSQVVHTADLSNPAKMKEVFDKWTDLVYMEFFNQGDVEKKLGMQISPLCDRKTVKIAKAQVGFIQYVVLPQFETMLEIMPELKFYKDGILSNLERYKAKQAEEEKLP